MEAFLPEAWSTGTGTIPAEALSSNSSRRSIGSPRVAVFPGFGEQDAFWSSTLHLLEGIKAPRPTHSRLNVVVPLEPGLALGLDALD